MTGTSSCKVRVKYCEDCGKWEPIPFHKEGGVCMSRKVVNRRQITPGFLRPAEKVSYKDKAVAAR
jgi:hypothetical protein